LYQDKIAKKTNFLGAHSLHAAAASGNAILVKFLLKAHPLLAKKTDNAGNTPLDYAIFYKNKEAVAILLAAEADDSYRVIEQLDVDYKMLKSEIDANRTLGGEKPFLTESQMNNNARELNDLRMTRLAAESQLARLRTSFRSVRAQKQQLDANELALQQAKILNKQLTQQLEDQMKPIRDESEVDVQDYPFEEARSLWRETQKTITRYREIIIWRK